MTLKHIVDFFFFEKQTHTHRGEGKWVLTQKHTTIPLKSHEIIVDLNVYLSVSLDLLRKKII